MIFREFGQWVKYVLDDLGFNRRMKKAHTFRAVLLSEFKATGAPEHFAKETYAGILDIAV